MIISLYNDSTISAKVKIKGYSDMIINPSDKTKVELHNSDIFKIQIRSNKESYKMKKIVGYCLIINVEYDLSGISDGTEIIIKREMIMVGADIHYDRFFLVGVDKAKILSEKISIIDENKIIKRYKVDFWKHIFIYNLIDNIFSIILITILIFMGISMARFFGIYFFLVYILLTYLAIVIYSWIIKIIIQKLFSRFIYKKKEDLDIYISKKNFYLYFQEDFINNYYSNLDREPYLPGKIEY